MGRDFSLQSAATASHRSGARPRRARPRETRDGTARAAGVTAVVNIAVVVIARTKTDRLLVRGGCAPRRRAAMEKITNAGSTEIRDLDATERDSDVFV
jgi:hypothetical protein